MSRPRFEIVQEDMGGWVRVFLGRGEPTGELGKFLSHGLTDWMRKRPHLRPFVVDKQQWGHGGASLVRPSAVPDTSPMADPEASGADR
ncbi:MAG: hypothetical protein U0744_18320 [Gemmataceae bacterium]